MRLNSFKHAFDRFPNGNGIARNCRVSGKLRAASAQALPSTMLDAACFFRFHAVSNTSVSEQYLVTR